MKIVDLQIEQLKGIFFQECSELLTALEQELSTFRQNVKNIEPLHAAFRAIHTIKGGAGMLGLQRIVDLAHAIESKMRDMRSGTIEINVGVVDAVIHATDVVADLIQAARSGADLEEGIERDALARLEDAAKHDNTTPSEEFDYSGDGFRSAGALAEDSPPGTLPGGENNVATDPTNRSHFRIAFRPSLHLLKRSNEPLLIFQHLRKLGTLTVEADTTRLPDFANLVPADAYLGWHLTLESNAPLESIKEAFEFVEGDCELLIEQNRREESVQPSNGIDLNPSAQTNPTDAPPLAAPGKALHGRVANSIRVDTERIDRLVNLVGELAITQAIIYQNIEESIAASNPRLLNEVSLLLRLTQSLHDGVMAIRAQPIRTAFARLPRIARDLSEQTGKPVRLEFIGEETEVDRTLIEQLGDPMMHLIRNAVDHGIETAQVRAANGKPPEGTILIKAAQRGNQVVIEFSDDGGGIDTDKVRRKSIDIGLISADSKLTDDEINNLIFAPSLSTADKVTSLSGRGVGLDVVKCNLQKLGGRISIASEKGKGTRLTLTLPLTLAVTDGMIVRVGTEYYVIPISRVSECIPLSKNQIKLVPGFGEILNSRGVNTRIVKLASVLDSAAVSSESVEKQLAVLVEIDATNKVALVVDEIVCQQQVVIKSLHENFEPPRGVVGATILGNGGIALFLDVSAIADISIASGIRPYRPPRNAEQAEQQASRSNQVALGLI